MLYLSSVRLNLEGIRVCLFRFGSILLQMWNFINCACARVFGGQKEVVRQI